MHTNILKKPDKCSDQFSDAVRTNKDYHEIHFSPTSCSPNTFNSESCKFVAVRPSPVSKVTLKSVDSFSTLL